MALTWPVLALVLAFTAVGSELRAFESAHVGFEVRPVDLILNVAGYLPVGVVLVRLGLARALAVAAALTLGAEVVQAFTLYRFPSPVDVVANLTGAGAGWVVARALPFETSGLRATRATGWASLAVAAGLVTALAVSSREARNEWRGAESMGVNPAGAVEPGGLEAHWPFDRADGSAVEAGAAGPDGSLHGTAVLAEGLRGSALLLDGRTGYADFGAAPALRLSGSVTVTAWIRSSSYPDDDAAIVSSHVPGYQLDTTVDRGARTIGFKLTDLCGNVMARYGRTPLALDTWYHVAGVYDADARTMNVYLDGRLDDGDMLAPIGPLQNPSPERVLVGRRPEPDGFRFAGSIDDARIYSRALTAEEVGAVRDGGLLEPAGVEPGRSATARELREARLPGRRAWGCRPRTEAGDAFLPGLATALGVLLAVAWIGLTPWRGLVPLGLGAAAGSTPLLFSTTVLPAQVLWILPIAGAVGAATVLASVRHARTPEGEPP